MIDDKEEIIDLPLDIQPCQQSSNTKLTKFSRREELNKHVINWICQGVPRHVILDNILNDKLNYGYKYSEIQANKIYYACRKQLKDDFEDIKEQLQEDLYSKLTTLYNKNFNSGDYKEARECLREIMKLTGIANKLDNSVTIQKPDENIIIKFGFNE